MSYKTICYELFCRALHARSDPEFAQVPGPSAVITWPTTGSALRADDRHDIGETLMKKPDYLQAGAHPASGAVIVTISHIARQSGMLSS